MSRGERELLLSLLRELSEDEFQSLKLLLEEHLPRGDLDQATRPDVCRRLLQRCPGRALIILTDLLLKISRHDLVQRHGLPGAQQEPPAENGDTGGHPVLPPSVSSPAACPLPTACPPPAAPPRILTQKELMQIAQMLGKEWQEIGIVCLGLERSRLEQIQEDNTQSVVMQRFAMLLEWQRREKQEATAARLRECLAHANVDPKVFDLLQSFQGD